ncbi:MurR/RpiR family transcriptional regulator [Albidovulum sp.]|uniref:MurR/RpiR family transcriptional regulator n=1 Tax=Albidovulum sp. TaxID=1872424 RepID=UPI002C4257E9|nr:MurR/RpiR family transcriptional regulator [Paracoccaceae bacterium]HPE24053.1 MurR/RpiR family transcriptional regulator [Albidovulum sp.]MCP5323172.1 MurR/RpiR family transcriptional regulator [Paracoccaceae bacterium]MCP5354295.1 MurR/RpiR family transcriptional regulator [Paracoccaceae bacterium]MCP5375968.1 MurR/RpiR family transcriptional regulator [Paracoccaceae bacterium]
MPALAQTVEQRIRARFDALTRSERQLASHITRHYPVSVLGSITALAREAEVSTPTVVRLVQKLGYKGYPDFQGDVRSEVEERLISPIAKHDRWAVGVPDTHILNRFADAVVGNLQATLGQIDHAEFDAIAALMADRDRKIFAMGGRITHAMADYFVTQMKVMRQDVTLLSEMSNAWPPALIDMAPGDVLLVFDIRRYENNVLTLVEMAADQGAEVVLITDQWVSPAADRARYRLSAHIEVPSAWDSTVAIQVLVETLMAAVQSLTWDETQARMKRLEDLYARARFFRRGK